SLRWPGSTHSSHSSLRSRLYFRTPAAAPRGRPGSALGGRAAAAASASRSGARSHRFLRPRLPVPFERLPQAILQRVGWPPAEQRAREVAGEELVLVGAAGAEHAGLEI